MAGNLSTENISHVKLEDFNLLNIDEINIIKSFFDHRESIEVKIGYSILDKSIYFKFWG